jgi:hypothetical protein
MDREDCQEDLPQLPAFVMIECTPTPSGTRFQLDSDLSEDYATGYESPPGKSGMGGNLSHSELCAGPGSSFIGDPGEPFLLVDLLLDDIYRKIVEWRDFVYSIPVLVSKDLFAGAAEASGSCPGPITFD